MKLASLESLNAAIRLMVEKYPGCSPCELKDHWQRLFEEPLEPAEFGCDGGVRELLLMLSSRFHSLEFHQNSAGSLTVYLPKERGLPGSKILPIDEIPFDELLELEEPEDDPPEDAALNVVVPTQPLPFDFEEGTHFSAVITQVHSPGQFWFNIHGPGHFHTVTEMMDTMDKFYNSFMGNSYKIRNSSLLTPGSVIAARYRTDGYHRASVIKVSAHKMVKVCYIDYGTVDVQKMSHCRYLKQEWAQLPGQAIEAHLFGVEKKRDVATTVARDSMVQLTTRRPGSILAIIRSGVKKAEMVEIETKVETLVQYRGLALTLIDALTVMSNGLNINEELVKIGVCDVALMEAATIDSTTEGWKTVCRATDERGNDLRDVIRKLDKLVVPKDEILEPSLYLKLLRLHEINLKLTVNFLKRQSTEKDVIVKYEKMKAEIAKLKDEVETKEVKDYIEKLQTRKLLKTLKRSRKREALKREDDSGSE